MVVTIVLLSSLIPVTQRLLPLDFRVPRRVADISRLACVPRRVGGGWWYKLVGFQQFIINHLMVFWLADRSGRAVLRCESAVARLLGLQVRIPPGAWMSVECRLLSGRGLCDGPITHPG